MVFFSPWSRAPLRALSPGQRALLTPLRLAARCRQVPRYLSWLRSRRQWRYFLAKELADRPDHGGCGWVKWHARADCGTDTAPEECGHCLAGDLAI